jgi:hypothetical protein
VSATAANPCVLTLAADSRFNVDAVGFPPTTVTGIPAMVGMGMIPSGVSGMTQLNITKTTGGLTFGVGGSANIGGANTYVVGDWMAFTATSNLDIPTTNYMPPEVVVGKAYCVVSAGDPFQISLVAGGSPITFAAPDTQGRIISEQCFKVLAVNADGANTVRIEFNASGLTPGSGGDGKYAASRFLANNLAYGAKSCNNLGIATTQMFQNMYDLRLSSPYLFLGKWASHLVYFGSGSTWNVLDPDMNAPITPQWQAIIDWNYP